MENHEVLRAFLLRDRRFRRAPVLPGLKKLNGFAGVTLVERKMADAVEIVVITLWRSLESIRDFAGVKLEEAVVAEEAARLLTQFDRCVKHYDVVLQETV